MKHAALERACIAWGYAAYLDCERKILYEMRME